MTVGTMFFLKYTVQKMKTTITASIAIMTRKNLGFIALKSFENLCTLHYILFSARNLRIFCISPLFLYKVKFCCYNVFVDLFDLQNNVEKMAPLAERMRPRTIDEFLGQGKIVGAGSLLRRAISIMGKRMVIG